MTTTHTPGPWCVKGGTPLVGIDRPYDIIAGASLIAQTLIAPERSAAAANAALIAAAPDLLAALRVALVTLSAVGATEFEDGLNGETTGAVIAAAIAKATTP